VKLFTVAVMAIFLAACSNGPAGGGPSAQFGVISTPASAAGLDLYTQATLEAAQANRVAADIAIMEATNEAQRQDDVIAAVTAQHRATSEARAFELTKVADDLIMSREADEATATHEAAIAQAAYQIAATGTAVKIADDAYAVMQQERELAIIKEANITKRSEIKAWVFSGILALFIAAVCVVLVVNLNNIGRAKEARELAAAYKDMAQITPGGSVLTLANRQLEYEPRLLPAPVIEGEFSMNGDSIPDTLGRVPLMVNGERREAITLSQRHGDRNPERTNKVLVHRLLREARDYADTTNGPRDILPGNRSLPGFNPDMWTRATDVLERNRVIKKKARRATKFLDGWDIDTALMEGNLNRLNYSPAPPA
jgi:hypothetical protein